MRPWSLATVLLLLSLNGVWADATVPTADVHGARDNVLLKRYEDSFIVDYRQSAFDEISLPAGVLQRTDQRDGRNNVLFEPNQSVKMEGRVTKLVYVAPSDRSPLEVLQNYQDDLTSRNASVVYACQREACGGDAHRGLNSGGGLSGLISLVFPVDELNAALFSTGYCALADEHTDQQYFLAKLPADSGGAAVAVMTYTLKGGLYCSALRGRTIAIVAIAEPKSLERRMVTVKAADMAQAISSRGRIALYGINFDFDKSDVRPDSEPTIAEIATLLKADPALALYVVGHTDNAGTFEHNMGLSQRRAVAVVDVLIKEYQIPNARLRPVGVGPVAPVASNADESGRAQNRRVELVRQ